jgi:excisionase family DNA binding protein
MSASAGFSIEAVGRSGRLLCAEDVGELLGVAPGFVYALARRGELPCVRIGERYVRFRADTVELWITEQERSERSTPGHRR